MTTLSLKMNEVNFAKEPKVSQNLKLKHQNNTDIGKTLAIGPTFWCVHIQPFVYTDYKMRHELTCKLSLIKLRLMYLRCLFS